MACVSVDVSGDVVRESVECGLMGSEEVWGVVLSEEVIREEKAAGRAAEREERLKVRRRRRK